jgi:hypothetical protein
MLTGKHSTGAISKPWILNSYFPPPEPSAPSREKETIHGFVNAALTHDTIDNIIVFYHASVFSHVLSMWCESIDAG